MSEREDRIISAMAMALMDAGLHDEGCFLVGELAADLYYMTKEGSAHNPAQPPAPDEPTEAMIKQWYNNYLSTFGRGAEPADEYYFFEAGVKAMQSAALGSGWVSVEDRLPPYGRSVWVSYRFGQGEAWRLSSLGWVLRHMPEEKLPGVTHWMPLPTPPEDKSDE